MTLSKDLTFMSDREEKKFGVEKIFEKIMAENLPNSVIKHKFIYP